ncbi:MAG: PRD domain-containing protein [Propionibacteriaceae bacterium]|jgi:beta-glucoside operon transcriptional antiterminator|nr:PRD domain-containing protein [Propionibacteriaceae bacterium]
MEIDVDCESMSAARFVTHLRYLFVRLASDKQIHDGQTTLYAAVQQAHGKEFHCAQRIRYLLETSGAKITGDEVLYLTLHVARLAADVSR